MAMARELGARRAWLLGVALLPALVALAGCARWQKVELRLAPGTRARSELGQVRMDERTSDVLVVAAHRVRRDASGRLAVRVEFQNISDALYAARVRVEFVDAQGMLEKGAFDVDLRKFPPGTTTMDWTSSTPDAATYSVEVWSGSAVPW